MWVVIRRHAKLVILCIAVVVLLASVVFTPLGTWLRIGVAGLWEGCLNLPGVSWAREQMQTGPTAATDAPAESDVEAINATLERGQALQQEGALDEALRRYREALTLDEEYAPTRVALAGLYLELGREGDALRELEEAAALAPESSFVLRQLGRLYLNRDDYDDSVATLIRARDADPEDPIVRYWLGAAHFFRSHADAERAVSELERAAELDPEDAEIFFRLAMAYVRRDDETDVALAIASLERALELDSSQTEAYNYLGQLYLRDGRLEAAVEAWRKYVAESEDDESREQVRGWLRDLDERERT